MIPLAAFTFTIREAIRRGTLIFYFVIGTGIIIFLAFAISASGEDGKTLSILGKAVPSGGPFNIQPVEFLLVQLVRSAGQSLLLIGIFAVAGLIPSLLEKGTAELYLSKPISRPVLLLARAFGATTGIGINILYFAIGILLVFGIKIGVWHWPFVLSSLMIAVTFCFYFSVVTLTGVLTKSQGVSIIVAFMFTFFSGILAAREELLFPLWENSIYRSVLHGIYYLTPQLHDMMENSFRLVGTNPLDRAVRLQAPQAFTITPFVYSFLSASGWYALSAWRFSKQDY